MLPAWWAAASSVQIFHRKPGSCAMERARSFRACAVRGRASRGKQHSPGVTAARAAESPTAHAGGSGGNPCPTWCFHHSVAADVSPRHPLRFAPTHVGGYKVLEELPAWTHGNRREFRAPDQASIRHRHRCVGVAPEHRFSGAAAPAAKVPATASVAGGGGR